MSYVRTPRFFERQHRRRYSIHGFRWGAHYKHRKGTTFRHLVVKITRGAAYGGPNRRMLYVGWWETIHGHRGQLNGFRLFVGVDRLPARPRESMDVPFYPTRERQRG